MGHKGATRVLGEPNEIIHVTMEICPNCSHILTSPIHTERKTILDIPPPQKVKVTECDLDAYKCSNCGKEVKSEHRDCPREGYIGIYSLKYNLSGPIRRMQKCLKINNDLGLSVKGSNDALIRVGDACKSEYNAIQNRIRRSK